MSDLNTNGFGFKGGTSGGGGGATSDTIEEDQPELTYSEWLRSRQPS